MNTPAFIHSFYKLLETARAAQLEPLRGAELSMVAGEPQIFISVPGQGSVVLRVEMASPGAAPNQPRLPLGPPPER